MVPFKGVNLGTGTLVVFMLGLYWGYIGSRGYTGVIGTISWRMKWKRRVILGSYWDNGK